MKEIVREVTIEEPYGFIYITTNIVNGKRYLGRHKFSEDWKYYIGSGKVFKRAVKEYGRENFIRNIIDIAYTEEELNQKEYDYSVEFDVVESDDWYNLVYGGGTTTGYKMSDETKKKIGDKAKERNIGKTEFNLPIMKGQDNPMYGVSPKERMDEETYERWLIHMKEIHASNSEKMKGKRLWGENNPPPNLGKHLSESTKQKLSEAHKGIKSSNALQIYSPELNMFFETIKSGANYINAFPQNIGHVLNNPKKYAGHHPITGEPLTWYSVIDKQNKNGEITLGAISRGIVTQEEFNMFLQNLNKGD